MAIVARLTSRFNAYYEERPCMLFFSFFLFFLFSSFINISDVRR